METFKCIIRVIIFFLTCIPALLLLIYQLAEVTCDDWGKRLVPKPKKKMEKNHYQEIEGRHHTKYTEDIPAYNIRVEKPDGKTFWIPKEDIRTIAKNFCGMK